MSRPPNESSLSSRKPQSLLVYVERVRQQAEEFQKTVEKELRRTARMLKELRARQARRQ